MVHLLKIKREREGEKEREREGERERRRERERDELTLKACFASAATTNSIRASVFVGGRTTLLRVPNLPKRRERSLSEVW